MDMPPSEARAREGREHGREDGDRAPPRLGELEQGKDHPRLWNDALVYDMSLLVTLERVQRLMIGW